MREIDRIDRILDKIKLIWHEAPDQRLGQLLSNYVFGHHVDIWHMQDHNIELLLDKMLGLESPDDEYKRSEKVMCEHGVDISFPHTSACEKCNAEQRKLIYEIFGEY